MKKLFLFLFLLVSFQAFAAESLPEKKVEEKPSSLTFPDLLGAAEKGDARSMLRLGSCYEHGQGVGKNFVYAMEWYKKAAEAGLPEGLYNLGICYEIGMGNPGDPKRAVENFEKAADLGLVQAMEKLSSIYFAGKMCPQDKGKGLFWLKKAADSGSGSANSTLGLIYRDGLMGEKRNEKTAVEYFMKAADTGRLEAIRNLGRIYGEGTSRKKNPTEALKWYLIAQKGGDSTKDLDLVVTDLKRAMKPVDLVITEKEAENWIREYVEKKNVIEGMGQDAAR